MRNDNDPPEATARHGWRYHHVGIPTVISRPGERYLEQFKMYVSAFESSPCGIQWMRFEPDSPVHPLIQSVPHVAFEVDDLQAAVQGREILTPPNSPSAGVLVAMILDHDAPVELIEFHRGPPAPLRIPFRVKHSRSILALTTPEAGHVLPEVQSGLPRGCDALHRLQFPPPVRPSFGKP